MLAGDMAMRLRKTLGSSSRYLLASASPRGIHRTSFPSRMTMPPAHRRVHHAPRTGPDPSKPRRSCGEGKAVQRIPRSVSGNGQVPWVHQTATGIPWLLPEAHDPLRRLALHRASARLAGDMAMRLRKTHGSSSACLVAPASPRGIHCTSFPARITMPPADRRCGTAPSNSRGNSMAFARGR